MRYGQPNVQRARGSNRSASAKTPGSFGGGNKRSTGSGCSSGANCASLAICARTVFSILRGVPRMAPSATISRTRRASSYSRLMRSTDMPGVPLKHSPAVASSPMPILCECRFRNAFSSPAGTSCPAVRSTSTSAVLSCFDRVSIALSTVPSADASSTRNAP